MKLEKIFVVLGPPGSGKGTQSKLLAKVLGYGAFSTGEMLRDIAKEDSEFGKKIKDFIDNGIIIPDEMMRDIFRAKVKSLADVTGLILDGYPRSLGQIIFLDELILELDQPKVTAIFLEVDKEKLLARLAKRKSCAVCHTMYKSDMPEYKSGVCSKCGGELIVRADDDPAVMEKRFDEYQKKTAAVKDYYQREGKLTEINGDQPIEEVHQEILNKLEIK